MVKKSQLGISHDYENPFIIFDLGIRKEVINYIFDHFEDCFSDFFKFDEGSVFDNLFRRSEDKTESIKRFIERIETDEENYYECIRSYISACHNSLEEHFPKLEEEKIRDNYNRITRIIIDESQKILESYISQLDTTKFVTHYRVNYKLEMFIEDESLLLLLPFYYIVYAPYQGRDKLLENIYDYIHRDLKEDDPISINQLQKNLIAQNISINLDFLKFLCLNDENTLTLYNATKVDLIEEIIPSAKILALNVDPSRYYRISNYSMRSGFSNIGMEIKYLDKEFIIEYLQRTKNDKYHESINLNELICKLRIIKREKENLHQGIYETTYNAIIKLLEEKKQNLSYQQICSLLFVDEIDNLSPTRLPPGRLLAYGFVQAKRYLKKATAVYTLLDWVETEENKKGKILIGRILTPIALQNIEIDQKEVIESINQDKYYNKFGIINSLHIYEIIRRQNQLIANIYYDTQARQIIEKILDEYEKLTHIGQGYYIHDNFLDVEREDMTTSKWRKMIGQSIQDNIQDLDSEDLTFLDTIKNS